MDFVYARFIFALCASKSTGPGSITLSGAFFGFGGIVAVRVTFIPVRTCCGEPDRSATFCLELAVEAEETGCRGRELRRGGDNFGRGAEIYAFKLALLFKDISVLLLPRERVGVLDRLVGVVERPAGLQGLFSWLLTLKPERRPEGEVAREFTRVDAALEDSEDPLKRFDLIGIREVVSCGEIGVATVVLNVGFTPFMVLTLVSGISL